MQEIETIRRALSTANTNFYIDALEALAKLEAKLCPDNEQDSPMPYMSYEELRAECLKQGELTQKYMAKCNELEAKLNKPVDVEKVSKAIYDAYYTDWDDETDRYKDFLRRGAFAAIAEIENQRL